MRNLSQTFVTMADASTADQCIAGRDNWIGAQPCGAGKRSGLLRVFVMLFLVLVCFGCTKTPPEQALRSTITQMQQAGSEKDVAALMKNFAEDFSGSEGMDHKQFRQYVSLIWLRHKDIGIQMGPLDVTMMDDRATVNFTVALSGGEGLIPDQGQIYQVQTGWRRKGDDWLLISANWK
jgi:hypothetical protein